MIFPPIFDVYDYKFHKHVKLGITIQFEQILQFLFFIIVVMDFMLGIEQSFCADAYSPWHYRGELPT